MKRDVLYAKNIKKILVINFALQGDSLTVVHILAILKPGHTPLESF